MTNLVSKFQLLWDPPPVFDSGFPNQSLNPISCHQLPFQPEPHKRRVPQGSVQSAPLFLIAMNDSITNVHFSHTQIFFTDNFSIHLQSSSLKLAHKLIQTI